MFKMSQVNESFRGLCTFAPFRHTGCCFFLLDICFLYKKSAKPKEAGKRTAWYRTRAPF